MDPVAIYPITQATTATFSDLYLRLTFLFFIESGSKRVVNAQQDLVGQEGDLLIFPAGSMVTMENRGVLDRHYRAVGVSFEDDFVRDVFAAKPVGADHSAVQVLRAGAVEPMQLLSSLRQTVQDQTLPDAIRRHRLLEPLIWLRHHGVQIQLPDRETVLSRVRQVIEADLTHDWRSPEVAAQLAMSEATMRRHLAQMGQGFSRVLLHTRLERGLTLLQTTTMPIAEVALDCGFKTPSHFSDAFRKRFGIRPKEIRFQDI
ncbi:AraC family transcriptional regulator [Thalassobius sp. Cn5-15]|uniref:helix-turn-helix transcriptional regulator n=1 Tax=Thalassobius sp. Cn5-15 TaxID=2917763 RepID=UPI001EF1D971|nr:AraC family transcriptional regulator [Thalassobius sp. Cn5-15]MCG7492933.1 AraC family transcriptional regulator [Thalassobius sp. Cn5-15]